MLWLSNPPEPSAQPTLGCGKCPCVPRYWRIKGVVVTGFYSVMSGDWILSRPSVAATKTLPGTPTSVTFSGSGSWPVPAGVTTLTTVELWGDGGAGGSSENGPGIEGGCGGGSGGYTLASNVSVTPNQSIAYACGPGGTATNGTLQTGGSGTGTTCSTLSLSAGGGHGGGPDPSGGGSPGDGGTGTTPGNAGAAGTVPAGGKGGDAPHGGTGGAGGPSQNTPGSIGTAPGAGGGGAGEHYTISGAGAAGQIKFTYTPSTVFTLYDPSTECVWSVAHRVDSQTTYYWYLYHGDLPEGLGSGFNDFFVIADVRSRNLPNDIDAWGPNALASQLPRADAQTPNWNCLSTNTMQAIAGGLGFPSQIVIEPYWP